MCRDGICSSTLWVTGRSVDFVPGTVGSRAGITPMERLSLLFTSDLSFLQSFLTLLPGSFWSMDVILSLRPPNVS